MSSAICFNLDQSEILSFGNGLTLFHTIPTFSDSRKIVFENIQGKEKNASLFSTLLKTNFSVWFVFILCLQMLSIWTSLKFCRLVKS